MKKRKYLWLFIQKYLYPFKTYNMQIFRETALIIIYLSVLHSLIPFSSVLVFFLTLFCYINYVAQALYANHKQCSCIFMPNSGSVLLTRRKKKIMLSHLLPLFCRAIPLTTAYATSCHREKENTIPRGSCSMPFIILPISTRNGKS